jgi:hypothetical protein
LKLETTENWFNCGEAVEFEKCSIKIF